MQAPERMTVEALKAELKARGLKLPKKPVQANLIELVRAAREPGYGSELPPQPPLTYQAVTADPRANWREFLREHGWCIVPVPDFQAEKYVVAIQAWLASFCPLRLDDPSSWKKSNEPYNLHGILKHYVGHTSWLWEIREKCLPIFSALHGTDDLLVSFDGINVSWPRPDDTNNLHVDTMRNELNWNSVQGLVNLLPNGPLNGGLCVRDGSHTKLAGYYRRFPGAGLGWSNIDNNDPEIAACPVYKLCLQPGEMALWDSRTVHCAVQPKEGIRLAAYVCMRPRSGATPRELEKRMKLYWEGRQTNHNCYGPNFEGLALHPWVGRTPNNPRPAVVEVADLNTTQARLAGFPPGTPGVGGRLIDASLPEKSEVQLPYVPPGTETVAVHLKMKGGQIVQDCDVYVARRWNFGGWDLPESPFHNPFKAKDFPSIQACLAAYLQHLLARPDLLALLPQLRGKRLGCWCKPAPCHADIIVELVKRLT